MKYDPTDRVHAQISKDALDICGRNGAVIVPGFREDKSPVFRGLTERWWRDLLRTNVADFRALVAICRADFPTYCALLLRILNRLTQETAPFIWNEGQTIIWNRMVVRQQRGEPLFFVVLKARQQGITTFNAAWHHWHLWKGQDVRTLNVTHDDQLAKRVIGFFRLFHEGLPDVGGIRPKLRAETKSARVPKAELYYAENRCHGETHVAKNLNPRGSSARLIGLSEGAFYPSLTDLSDALMPQLPSIGSPARAKCSLTVESTPNGQNDFYDLWEETKEPDSEFWGIFLPWYVLPSEYSKVPPPEWRMTEDLKAKQAGWSLIRRKIDGHDVTREQMYWYERTLGGHPYYGSQDAFDQEYPSDDTTCFMLRSKSVFAEDLRYLQACVADASVKAKAHWAIRADTQGRPMRTDGPARGELVFPALRSPFGPENAVGWQKYARPSFRQCEDGKLLVWEAPQPGHVYVFGADTAGGNERDNSCMIMFDCYSGKQVAEFADNTIRPEDFADFLVHCGGWYNNATAMPEINHLGSVVMKRMSNDWGYTNFAHEEKWDEVGVKKDKPGWWTNERNRPVVFSSLVWLIQERFLEIASPELLREMSNFKVEGMVYSTAKKHQHDDRVVAAGLACVAIRQSPRFLMLVDDARRKRASVPSAIDLGLNKYAQAAPRVKNDDEGIARALFKGMHAIPAPGHQRW
jgi:hypothetical protein